MANELFNIEKAIETYSEKRGYTEGIKYYTKIIKGNRAVSHSEYYGIVKRFDEALKDFVDNESTTALVDMTIIFPEFYNDDEGLPDIFIAEGLVTALDCISEYMMHLSKLYHLDYYK